ncbi:MAG: nucleotidyltransferase domain-containing protein [Candidatus Caldarchaeum sp.]|nr:nucleotidyltransferase domain-containing protein [Candidatus Caldarchaeum sp.]MDW8063316.1 nucleotidyltransferase domain-containing protein [Candidatus Caldarchaeum sp.]MDW8360706.1 nucleotidyltransferase domain-containing protein [Candidatus Caldarchaeum sp.]
MTRPVNLEKVQQEYRGLVEDYFQLLQKRFGERLRSVCVFGSVATGRAGPESDIDILVVVEGLPDDVLERAEETVELLLELKQKPSHHRLTGSGRSAAVSPIFLTPSEAEKHPPIMLDIADEGVIIFDKEEFLSNVLKSIRKRLEELGARKVVTSKGHYWVLKPDLKPGEVVEI